MYLAVFLVVAALDSVVATTWIRPDLTAVVGTLLWAGSMLVIYAIDPWPNVNGRVVWLGIAWLVSAILMLAVAEGFWAFVLHQRGQQVVASVVEVHHSDKGSTTYTLSHGGRRIPGRLTNWPGNDALFTESTHGTTGDQVIVVRDLEGLVDPRLPERLAEPDEVAGNLLLAVAVLAALCIGAAWSQSRQASEKRRPVARRREAG
ncbi:hypothetical protein GA0074692_5507 [Micromonospora pallida]|uniref:Uncharacterized protein n=1 Tax=Micromonospora pallida TaxID=145854 RepID=A0A1C6TEA7_9ACTN|nr:hypothetical protein GA0074692_5507 [Micromonospora pallida]